MIVSMIPNISKIFKELRDMIAPPLDTSLNAKKKEKKVVVMLIKFPPIDGNFFLRILNL